ncbi:MAG: hypothetical protein AB7H86_06950 [Blastocatellales bacterium]
MPEKLTMPKFRQRLLARYFVRLHMTLILGAVVLSGVITSKLLLLAGLRSMAIRYPIAVLLAYLVFFVLIRLWLWYVGISPQARESTADSGGFIPDISPGIDIGSRGTGWGGFGGGTSGGGGASDSWGESASEWLSSTEPPPSASPGSFSLGGSGSSSGKGSGGSLFDLDLGDDGCLPIIVMILLAALILLIFGSAAWLIYQAPAIFAEAAFEAALASGLIRASKGIDSPDWKGSILKATWLPFVLVLVMSIALGWTVNEFCPDAATIREAFLICG